MKTFLLCGLLSLTAAQQSAAANWNGLLESHVYATHGIKPMAENASRGTAETKNATAAIAIDASIIEAVPAPFDTLEVLVWERHCNRDLQVVAGELPDPMPLDFEYIDRKLTKRKK